MEKRRKKSPVDKSEKIVERLQKKALAEEEKRKKPGECLKVNHSISKSCNVFNVHNLSYTFSI